MTKTKRNRRAKTPLTDRCRATRTASTKTLAPRRRKRNLMEMTTTSTSKPTKNGGLNTPTVKRTPTASLRMTAKNSKRKQKRKTQETTEH